MLMRKLTWMVLLLCIPTAWAKAPAALFYLMETPKSMRSFEEHIDKIDLLVPTWYGVDGQGLVQGAPNPFVLQLASQKQLPVMPILSMTQAGMASIACCWM